MSRGAVWPVAMGGLLALTVAANIAVVVVANGDPSFAIEQDYYQRAVHWDERMAQERRNRELGWTLVPSLDMVDATGAHLRVRLTDAAGTPIRDAVVRVEAVHIARAGDVVRATLNPSSAREYAARLPVQRHGRWELRFAVSRGTERFTAVARLDATTEGAGS